MLVGAVSTFNNSPRMLKQNDETKTNSASYQIRTASTVPRNFEGSNPIAFGMKGSSNILTWIFGGLLIIGSLIYLPGCNPDSTKPKTPVDNTPTPGAGATVTPGVTVTPAVTPTPIPGNQVLGKYEEIVVNGLGLTEPYAGAAPTTTYYGAYNYSYTEVPKNNTDTTKLPFNVTADDGISPPVRGVDTYYMNGSDLMCQKSGLSVPLKVVKEDGSLNGVVSQYVKYYKPDGSLYIAKQKDPDPTKTGIVNTYTQVTTQVNGKSVTMKENGVPVMNPTGQLTKYSLNGNEVVFNEDIDIMFKKAEYADAYHSFIKSERKATPFDRAKAIVGEVIENGKGKVQGALAKTKNAAAAGETGYRVIFENGVELAMNKAGKIIGEVGDKVVKCA